MTWRLYCEADEDPYGTCINCGQVTYDLTDIGETRNAGSWNRVTWQPCDGAMLHHWTERGW